MARKDTAKTPKPKSKKKVISRQALLTTLAIQELALKGTQLRIDAARKDYEQAVVERDVAVEGALMQHAEMIHQDRMIESVLNDLDGILDRIARVLDLPEHVAET